MAIGALFSALAKGVGAAGKVGATASKVGGAAKAVGTAGKVGAAATRAGAASAVKKGLFAQIGLGSAASKVKTALAHPTVQKGIQAGQKANDLINTAQGLSGPPPPTAAPPSGFTDPGQGARGRTDIPAWMRDDGEGGFRVENLLDAIEEEINRG